MTTALTHACNGDAARGAVCSHLATDGMLAALGFPVLAVNKIVGGFVVQTEGTARNVAVHAAWHAGKVRICTKTARTAP